MRTLYIRNNHLRQILLSGVVACLYQVLSLNKMRQCLAITLKAKTADGFDGNGADKGMASKLLTTLNIGQMYLYGGNAYCLDGIGDGNAGMRISGGIDDDTVIDAVSGLNFIYDRALVIGLE